jgi:hypothetical protein
MSAAGPPLWVFREQVSGATGFSPAVEAYP